VNPDERHASTGFDGYVEAIVDALDTVTEITGGARAHLFGLCGGGLLAVMAAAYLAANGRDVVATLTVGISVIDYGVDGPSPMSFLDRRSPERAIAAATTRGYLDARQTARSFALLRPIDGIWTSFVNNYVLGLPPPAVPLLQWASDQTNDCNRPRGSRFPGVAGRVEPVIRSTPTMQLT
jgi:polyhydroxyalkanoate synthase